MKKLVNLLLYGLLAVVAAAGIMGMQHYMVQDNERIELEAQEQRRAALAQAEEEARQQEEERKKERDRRMVLVRELPLYPEKNVKKVKAGSSTVCVYGEAVTLLEEDGLYAKVQTEKGETGYVWSDCIAAVSDENALAAAQPKVLLIDVEETKTRTDSICFSVARNLEKRLEALGYTAVMTCRDAAQALPDAKRAELASQIQADAVIRICAGGGDAEEEHATGTDDGAQAEEPTGGNDPAQTPESTGRNELAVFCSTKENPHTVAEYYADSKKLGRYILKYYQTATGFDSGEVVESGDQEALNKSSRPMVVLCLGSLQNEQQAAKIVKPKFQAKMAKGITDGVDAYFRKKLAE